MAMLNNQMVLKSENLQKEKKEKLETWKSRLLQLLFFLFYWHQAWDPLVLTGSGPLSYARMGKLHLADDLAMTELWKPQLFVDD